MMFQKVKEVLIFLEKIHNYEYYKKKAVEDSVYIRETFSWDNAAKKASNILNDFANKGKGMFH